MKNWKRLLALLLSLAMIAALCACNSDGGDAETSPSPDAEGSSDPDPATSPAIDVDLTQDILAFSAGLSADDALLTINGTPVAGDLMLYWVALSCNNFMSTYGMWGLQLTDDVGDGTTYAEQMRTSAVTIATYNVLLQQKAAELGCLPTDAQVQEAHDTMMSDGQETYDTWKATYGLTDESLEYLFLSDAYYENVLDATVPTATDEMLNNYVYQAKHILLKTVDTDAQPELQEDGSYVYPSLDEETVAQKRQQAEDILAQLQAADDLEATFDELMNEYSEDGRGEDGALLSPDGYTTTVGQMVPEFEQAALALEFGGMSGIVESSFGYHIILRGEVEDLESYAEECRDSQLDQMMADLLETAEIVRDPALDALDVAAFFDKYVAYQDALLAQLQPEDELDPVSSEGVG